MTIHPELINNFLSFSRLRLEYDMSGILDLSSVGFYFPTTLLPLINFIRENAIEYYPHYDTGVNNYILAVTNKDKLVKGKSYVPIVKLPEQESPREIPYEAEKLVGELSRFVSKNEEINSFGFVLQELADNIYEHSNFNNGYVMAQRYPNKNFVELCIYDDGMSIPGSIEKKYKKYLNQDSSAISAAIVKGVSTKKEEDKRGNGLHDSINLFAHGLNGEILIISRNGANFINKGCCNGSKKFPKIEPTKYKLTNFPNLDGTLIGIRVPIPLPEGIEVTDFFR